MFSIYFACTFESEGTREPRRRALGLNLTFEVRLTLWSITFDIKAHLSGNASSSGDDDIADVASGVRLLGVVDVDGEVG